MASQRSPAGPPPTLVAVPAPEPKPADGLGLSAAERRWS
jgi:hypothetical protein